MVAIFQRRLEEVLGELVELGQHGPEAFVADRIVAAPGGSHRREADLPETHILVEVIVDPLHVENVLRQRDPGADRPALVAPQELAHLGRDDVVATTAGALEDAQFVLHLLGTVDRDRDPDLVVGQPFDDVGAQQRGVGRQAELDALAELGGAAASVLDRLLQHREVHQRLAAEEGQVHGLDFA